jgi:hypothetical protein
LDLKAQRTDRVVLAVILRKEGELNSNGIQVIYWQPIMEY